MRHGSCAGGHALCPASTYGQPPPAPCHDGRAHGRCHGGRHDAHEVMAQLRLATSRVHFRRGFHDNGFAKTILLVEPTEPFLGTVRLNKLPYENVDLKQYYPYGNPVFPG